jgi:hypothetical protein
MRLRVAVYFIIANVVGLVFLWLAARGLPLGDIGQYLEQADVSRIVTWSVIFLVVYSACHLARILRWDALVDPLGPSDDAPIRSACVVGFSAILLLPLRLGEFVRPALLARRSNLSVASLLATAVVERVTDGLLVTGLLFVTLLTYTGGMNTGFAQTTGLVAAAIFIPALLVCSLALWRRQLALRILRFCLRPFPQGITDKFVDMLDTFIDGFKALSNVGALRRFLGMTAVYWGLNILSFWLLAHFGFGLDVGLVDSATVIAILVIGIMIPAAVGLTGNFELFMTRGLALFVSIEQFGAAVACLAALVHVLQFLIIMVPGFVVMWMDPEARHLLALSQAGQSTVSDDTDGPEGELADSAPTTKSE